MTRILMLFTWFAALLVKSFCCISSKSWILITHMNLFNFRKTVYEQKCPAGAKSKTYLGACQTSMMQPFAKWFLKKFLSQMFRRVLNTLYSLQGFMKRLFTLQCNDFLYTLNCFWKVSAVATNIILEVILNWSRVFYMYFAGHWPIIPIAKNFWGFKLCDSQCYLK